MGRIIDGKRIAERINGWVASRVARLHAAPRLAVILVGEHPASETYVRRKMETGHRAGIETTLFRLGAETTEGELLERIAGLNRDPDVHGILVQLPLPEHVGVARVIEAIEPAKDVDGFHPQNIGRLSFRSPIPYLHPCTPWGIVHVLDTVYPKTGGRSGLEGRVVTVIGQSNIVGRPLSIMLQNDRATVRMADKHTRDLEREVRGAEVIVSATGVHGLVSPQLVRAAGRDDVTLIDAGITRVNGRLVGDADPAAHEAVAAYTPVPGGIGPVTVAFLLRNLLKAYHIQHDWPIPDPAAQSAGSRPEAGL